MGSADVISDHVETGRQSEILPRRTAHDAILAIYASLVLISISLWFLAIRAPLWLDETGSYWDIKFGFRHIWSHQFITLCFPSYTSILWLSTKIFGTSEVALRTPSVLAMMGAVWLLYLAARELFDRDVAAIAVAIFSVNSIVIFESIDVRPYAFGAFATTAAILILLRLRRSNSNWLAAAFGLAAAVVISFHYLFATILPAFLLCFFVFKRKEGGTAWRQFGIAAAVFALASLPMLPGLHYLFHTSSSHVYEPKPRFEELIGTFGSRYVECLFGGAAIIAGILVARKSNGESQKPNGDSQSETEGWKVLVCLFLGLIPLLTLFGVSELTPIHMFAARHRLVALPGIALCWALLVERYLRPRLRLLFCIALVGMSVYLCLASPTARKHYLTWKYALQFAQQNASPDDAPVVICSDYPEADYVPMPLDSAKNDRFYSQLSYYQLSMPVVPMPRGLNAEAIRVGSQFLQEAAQKHERFLALGWLPSYPTLNWLAQRASPNFNVRLLGTFDGIAVLEFRPAR